LIRSVLLGLGFAVIALACGRTPLHRCDLVGCPVGICVDAGQSVGDAGADMFQCTLPDGGLACGGLGQECTTNGAVCCAGSACNSAGVCGALPPDAGQCALNGATCTTASNCCSDDCSSGGVCVESP
jgi:Ion channel inhibitory toxin